MADSGDQYPCKCCGFYTLTDPTSGSYEICQVCFWEDDPVQNEDALFEGGANAVSLSMALDNYIRFGVCDPQFSDRVRAPCIAEVPPPFVITGLEPLKREATLRGIKTLLLGIARALSSHKIKTFDGCQAIASVSFPLDEGELVDILRTFDAVASEVAEMPTGDTRYLWVDEALKKKDLEAAEYERRIRSEVETACRLLQERLIDQLTSQESRSVSNRPAQPQHLNVQFSRFGTD